MPAYKKPMAGVICQHRMVHTSSQQRSPLFDVSCIHIVSATITYLVVGGVEILRDGIAALRVDGIVGPLGDGCDLGHGAWLRWNMSCLDEVLYSASPRAIGSRVWSTEDIWRVHLHRFHLSCQAETSRDEAGRRILIPGPRLPRPRPPRTRPTPLTTTHVLAAPLKTPRSPIMAMSCGARSAVSTRKTGVEISTRHPICEWRPGTGLRRLSVAVRRFAAPP